MPERSVGISTKLKAKKQIKSAVDALPSRTSAKKSIKRIRYQLAFKHPKFIPDISSLSVAGTGNLRDCGFPSFRP
jgi:hypothetical protein